MAGLSNTGIKGFIASAKFTGSTILKKGKEIPEMVEHFLSGFAGYGWKIWEHRKGRYKLEIDDLNVRGTMTVYELLIQKIRAVIGALAITQGQGKIKSVALSPDQSEYLIQVEEDMSFREYDFIRCQTWTGNVKMYHVKIDRISDNTIIHVPIEEFDTDYDEYGQLVIHNAPAIGDEIVQFGNEVYEDRQSAIYLHADESGQPAIDIMFGINSKDWTNCVKGRMGGDIPGTDGAKGFYFENGMIKGTDETGHTVYCIYPNGDAMFGDESAMFNSDRSGQLAGGAIRWHFNDDKGRFELILGEDVIMSWDNLDSSVKDMLTPIIGENGNWWIGGEDTGQKAEGEDGTSPYIGENGNWWFGTTDTGVQAKANDGKSPYIGTNGNWFVWDDTLNEFVDSGDTSVGDDGKSPEIRDGYWWTWDGTEYVNTGVKAKGEDANLLPWIEEWDSNKTMIGTEQVVSPKMFSGTRDANGKLTGVALGRDCITIDGVKHTGIFALNEDEVMVELDPINKKYKFKGVINALSGRIGHLTIEELGRIVMKDPATAKERLIFANQDIPTVAYLEDQTQDGGNTSIEFLSVTTGVPSVYSSVLNVTQNGSTLTFGGATMNLQATAPIGYGGTVQLELTLERNGVPYASLGTVGIFVSGGQTEEESLIVAPKTWGGVSSGSYRVKLEFTSIGTYTSISGTSSTSTLSWDFSKNVEWFQFGLNGMMSWWQNLHAYFSNTEISFRAPSDKFNAPGVLAAGSVDAAGVQANVWGAKSNPAGAGAISGGRSVPLSNMKHDNYAVQITPHTATTFRVGTKTTISFQALGTGGFDYVVIGNNY